jgi:carboxyl-terminal processing protease
MAPGAIGITVRLIDGLCVIASVEAGSPAAVAGLRPGYVITAIDGRAVSDLLETAAQFAIPPFNPRNRENTVTRYLLGQIRGAADTAVCLSWEDQTGQPRESTIMRTSTGPGVRLVDFLPPYHLTFTYRQLGPDIGYVRFNHFAPPVDRQLAAAMETLPPDAGLIIDLRGTPGGYLRSLDTVAGMLVEPSVVLYHLEMREQHYSRKPIPAQRVLRGPVAVIVDALSLSASEILAGCLQELGRAVIVGSRSPGYVLTANWTELPNGAFLMYTIGRNATPRGHYLENAGVSPDIEVALDRRSLLEGRDVQIEAARRYLEARRPAPLR